jgi:hypothetical protein
MNVDARGKVCTTRSGVIAVSLLAIGMWVGGAAPAQQAQANFPPRVHPSSSNGLICRIGTESGNAAVQAAGTKNSRPVPPSSCLPTTLNICRN